MDEPKVRIAWTVIETGAHGFGEPIDKAEAEAWLDFLDAEYGKSMQHWIVTEGENKVLKARL